MAVYTYTGNLDPGERTSVLVLRDGGLRVAMGQWADFTAPELATLSPRFRLTAGMVGYGPAPVQVVPDSDARLKAYARAPGMLLVGTFVRDDDEALIGADAVWPDGGTGVYVGTPSAVTPGAVDSWTITYENNGISKTLIQPTMTRNDSGGVEDRPDIEVS